MSSASRGVGYDYNERDGKDSCPGAGPLLAFGRWLSTHDTLVSAACKRFQSMLSMRKDERVKLSRTLSTGGAA